MLIQNYQKIFTVFAALAALAWLPTPAKAQFTLALSPVTARPGDIHVNVFGVLTNTGTTPVDFMTDDFTLKGGPSTADLTSAIIFSPDNLLPAAPQPPDTLGANSTTASAPLFWLDTDSLAPLGTYTGPFIITYGNQTIKQDLTITLANPAAVPEAGTLPLLALGVGYIFFAARRRRAAPQG